MTGEGYHHTPSETSDEGSDDSKDSSKAKKKAGELAGKATDRQAAKSEAVVDRGKDLWSKLLAEQKPGKDPDSRSAKPNDEESPSAETVPSAGSEQAEAEQALDGEESDVEAVLTPAENTEVDEKLKAANIEQLENEIAATDDEVEIAASQAAIEAVENMPASELELPADVEAAASAEEEPVPLEAAPDELMSDEAPLPLDEEDAVTLAAATSSGRNSGAGGGSGSTVGGGAVQPPHRPQPTPPQPPLPSRGPVTARLSTVNALLNRSADYQPDYHVNPNRAYLLVGGVVGYLIGRRRGRIKTERRMNKVVKKLEKQVEAKQRIIEGHIETAKQRVRREYWEGKTAVAPVAAERAWSPQPERIPSRPASPAAELAPATAGPAGRPELQPKVEQMDRTQLIEASSRIRFGETNLRRVYEAQLVDENGLRRLMRAAEQGQDLRRALAREFLAKELRFERDPRLRGQGQQGGSAVGGGAAFAGASAQSDGSQASEGHAQPPTPSASAPAVPTQPTPPSRRQTNISPAALILLTLFTLALAIYAVWLTLTR